MINSDSIFKVKYRGANNKEIDLVSGKVYECVGLSKNIGWYKVVDESGEDYLYPPEMFEIVEE